MSVEQIVEQLAFGHSATKIGPCLGMYISPEIIYIAQANLDKTGRAVVQHLVRIPVPAPKENENGSSPSIGTLNTSFLTDNAKLGNLIQESMSQFRWKTKNVMVTLSQHLGLLRYFTMPGIEHRFWKSAIPVEAKKYIPIPFDALSYDYQCVSLPPDAEKRSRQGSLIAVTQKNNLANIAAMLNGLGLSLSGMEVAPCSMLRLWQSLNQTIGDEPYGHAHFDDGMVHILLADKGLPVFFREVFLGEDAGPADQRKVDLPGCLAFAQKQFALGSIKRLCLSGARPQLAAWQEAFARETGLPVNIQETASLLGIKEADWGASCSVGASLRFLSPGRMTLDLGAVGRISAEEIQVSRDILGAGAALTALLLVLGIFKTGLYQYSARSLGALARDAQINALFRDKSAPAIEEMFNNMRTQSEWAQKICGAQNTTLTDLMKGIIESLPEKTWLTKISLERPIRKTATNSAVLTLSGHAMAQDPAREDDLAFQFRDRLQRHPVMSKMFPDIKLDIRHENTSSETGAGLNPDVFASKQEQRTTFKLTATARQ